MTGGRRRRARVVATPTALLLLFLTLFHTLFLTAIEVFAGPGGSAATSVPPPPPEGARRWDFPGGYVMLPDWAPRREVVEKATGTITLARPGAGGGGTCFTWTYQADPLTMSDLKDLAPTYLDLLGRFLKFDLAEGGRLVRHGDAELNVVSGHAAVASRFTVSGQGQSEATMMIWDCSQSHRTFAFFCFAPQRAVASQLAFAIGKYANCHASKVDYGKTWPLAVQVPPGWKSAVEAPNQLVLAAPDEKSAVYLFMLAVSSVDRVTAASADAAVETLARLTGRLLAKEPPQVTRDPTLDHEIGRVRLRIDVDGREAKGLFDIWYCPRKQRAYSRVALSETVVGLTRARDVLQSVRCHE